MKIVTGEFSGAPILLLNDGFVYLRNGNRAYMSGMVGEFKLLQKDSALITAKPYNAPLTNEEEAIAMKAILLHG